MFYSSLDREITLLSFTVYSDESVSNGITTSNLHISNFRMRIVKERPETINTHCSPFHRRNVRGNHIVHRKSGC